MQTRMFEINVGVDVDVGDGVDVTWRGRVVDLGVGINVVKCVGVGRGVAFRENMEHSVGVGVGRTST